MNSHTSTATMARALRDLADLLDATPHDDLSPVWLQVQMQALITTGATRAARYDTVDRLAAVFGATATAHTSTYVAGVELPGASVEPYTGTLDDEDNTYVRAAANVA